MHKENNVSKTEAEQIIETTGQQIMGVAKATEGAFRQLAQMEGCTPDPDDVARMRAVLSCLGDLPGFFEELADLLESEKDRHVVKHMGGAFGPVVAYGLHGEKRGGAKP